VQVLRPQIPLPSDVYDASLSSLAKAILLQAETEVTAEKRSAKPLAQLTLNSMNVLDGFSAVFWAKLCQKTGGWVIPVMVPSNDVDGTPFTRVTSMKASGMREDETSADRTARVVGIMRVYFSLLLLRPSAPLSREFHLARLWMIIARLIGQSSLLNTSLATELLSGMSHVIFTPIAYRVDLCVNETMQSPWRSEVFTHAVYGALNGSSSWLCFLKGSWQILLHSAARV
jgi:nucleoporin GLE1